MSSNGHGTISGGYKRIGSYTADTIAPDAPEGGWQVNALAGKTKIKPTASGDPMVTFQFRLTEADEDNNESYTGTQLVARVIFYSEDDTTVNPRAKKMNKQRLHELCRAAKVDLNVIPTGPWENPEEALTPFVEAVEGAGLIQAYTVHRTNKDTGMKDVELQFKKPGTFTTPGSSRGND